MIVVVSELESAHKRAEEGSHTHMSSTYFRPLFRKSGYSKLRNETHSASEREHYDVDHASIL